MTVTSYRPAKTPTRVIQCDCKVCNGIRAEVPVGMLARTKPGTKSHRTVIHNLVCIAWSPVGIGANLKHLPGRTATTDLTAVQALLEERLTVAGQVHETHLIEQHGIGYLVSRRDNGTWVLSDESILRWYDADNWTDAGGHAFETLIDATTPRYVADSAADIILAPADQRAYIAAVNGTNLVQG
jgi:hypothetical protein